MSWKGKLADILGELEQQPCACLSLLFVLVDKSNFIISLSEFGLYRKYSYDICAQ